MTTGRPYHRALSVQEALDEVRSGRRSQFTPAVVDAFLAALSRGSLARIGAAGEEPLKAVG